MNEKQKEEMITQSTIIGMGWTKSMIDKFLPEPTLKDNPHYKNAAPMKLWRKNDVIEIMETPEFIEAMEKAAKRKEAAGKAKQTKQKKLADEMEKVIASLSVLIVPEKNLIKRTIKAKNEWYAFNASLRNEWLDYEVTVGGVDDSTLNRWVVNYIRHRLVRYDDALRLMDGRVGKYDVYPEFKRAVLEKIAEAFPNYAAECQRQIDELAYLPRQSYHI
ncbi:MAG: hypothetical protein ACI4EF_06165 [Coprococcus sp.]